MYLFITEYNTASSLETNLKPMDLSATPNIKNSPYQSRDDDLIDLSVRDLEDYKNKRHLQEEANDWLSCISKKTGLPRLVLSWLLLMCAIVMIWLCLSAAVTSPEQKVYNEPQVSVISSWETNKCKKRTFMLLKVGWSI